MVGKNGVVSWVKWGMIKNVMKINISSHYILFYFITTKQNTFV